MVMGLMGILIPQLMEATMATDNSERPGFCMGLFLGMILPLLMLGGEINMPINPPKDSFYGGLVMGILTDIGLLAVIVWLSSGSTK